MNARPAGDSDDYDSDEYYDEYDTGFDYPRRKNHALANRSYHIPIETRLENAIKDNSLEEVEELTKNIDNLQNLSLGNGWHVVTFAANYGSPQILNYVMKFQSPLNLKDSFTPLMAACSPPLLDTSTVEDRIECIKLLLNARLDVNFKDRYGISALMNAAKHKQAEIIEFLIGSGANVDDCDNDGWSAIFHAVNTGDAGTVKVLLQHNADITKADKRSRKPYQLATEKNFPEIAELVKSETDKLAEEKIEEEAFIMKKKDDNYDLLEQYPTFSEIVLEMVESAEKGMELYLRTFASHNLNLREFLLVKSDQRLREIGVLFSMHRYCLLQRIKEFHLFGWSKNSFGLNEQRTQEPDGRFHLLKSLNFLATLYRQLYVLRTTVQYVKDDIGRFPENRVELVKQLVEIKSKLEQLQRRMRDFYYQSEIIRVQTHPFLTALELTD